MDHASSTPGKSQRTSRVLLRAQLPVSPAAPHQARQHLRQTLIDRGLSALSDTAELLASELVADAAEHAAGTKIGLVVRQSTAPDRPPTITCEVSHRSATPPRQRPAGPGQDTGRSLAIIAALATDSGVRARPNGTTCWFTLTTPDAAPSAAR